MYGSAEWQPKKKERKKVIAFYRNRHRRHCLKCSRTEYTDALFQFSFFFFGHWRRDPAEASPAIREEEKAIRACLVCLPIFSPHFWVAGGAWLHRWYWMKCPWWGTTRRAHSWRGTSGRGTCSCEHNTWQRAVVLAELLLFGIVRIYFRFLVPAELRHWGVIYFLVSFFFRSSRCVGDVHVSLPFLFILIFLMPKSTDDIEEGKLFGTQV